MIDLQKTSLLCTTEKQYCAAKMEESWQRYEELNWFNKAESAVVSMMDQLGIRREFYMIGGSAAMIGYGILLNRIPHDIDVIVPVDVFRILVEIIEKSYLFDHGPHSTYGNCLCASYIVKDEDDKPVVVDILAGSVNPPVTFSGYRPSGIYLQDLCQIREIKMNWNRPKDRADVELINKFLEPSLVQDLNKELDSMIAPASVTAPAKDEDDDLPF